MASSGSVEHGGGRWCWSILVSPGDQERRFDESTATFHQLDPARKAFASVPNFSNGTINRMMWKAEGWLMGYNGGPIRHPTSRVYDRDIAALRRGLQLAGLTPTDDPDERSSSAVSRCNVPALAQRAGTTIREFDRESSLE